ncbi:MAG TPA: thioredoxin domain-containing protein [Acidimicrobiales bacterium]|nr:thioredoxin domain-containing protein [Acidimicrobiales bacterium]
MNRLADASSPYLRQHADNPVEWYPWGPEALARAREEDKPLFVSIGYAACHWCHVMAHESFEDPDVAARLSDGFVSVKVDREERPDVDTVYMTAVQAMTGAGGWPMSVFCTPDGRPFFAGTYFPPADRHGLPSFRRVLEAVATAWSQRRDEVEAQAAALGDAVEHETRAVDRLAPVATDDLPDWTALSGRALDELAGRFDPRWGGFGPAPKFPRPAFVDLCLRAALTDRPAADDAAGAGPQAVPSPWTMATTTLDAMAAGGIYDHLAGGFARYSTDARWLVPHFEKMLTDQALLVRAYLHGWQVTGSPTYLQVVRETVEFVLAELSTPDGGFCASLDADAGGVEGGHATWTPAEVRTALSDHDGDTAALAATLCAWWGVTDDGDLDGRSVLHRPPGAGIERPPEVEAGRAAMLVARRRRPQPARDDKVLTEWHALFTASLAEAAWACDERRWARRAVDAGTHLFSTNRRADGRWLRSAQSGVPAFAGDYAAVVTAATWLATLTGDARWIDRGEETAGAMLDLFWDPEHGGLFTTGRDAEHLVARPKDVVDSALPSANAAGAVALLRLGALSGSSRWTDAGTRICELAAPLAIGQPLAVADLLAALALVDHGAQVVVAGTRPDLLGPLRRRWLPDAVVAWGEPGRGRLWEGRARDTAYVCHGFVCEQPTRDVLALDAQLDHLLARGRR